MKKIILFIVSLIILNFNSIQAYTGDTNLKLQELKRLFENQELEIDEFRWKTREILKTIDLKDPVFNVFYDKIKNKKVKKSFNIEFKHEGFNLVINNPVEYSKQYGDQYLYFLRRLIIDEIEKIWYKDWNNKTLFDIKDIEDNKIVYGEDKKEKDSIITFLENENIKNYNPIFKDKDKLKVLDKLTELKYNKLIIEDVSWFFMTPKLNYVNWNFDIRYLINHWKLEITTLRERKNVDQAYRLYNIKTAFEKFWNNKIILPNEVVSFIRNIEYDEKEKKNYKFWAAINWNKEVQTYGGWICWAATAIYQGLFLNKGIEVLNKRNHSWWYWVLYNATINWEKITTPGLDATVWITASDSSSTDVKFKNISKKPILFWAIVNSKNVEKVFTLSEPWNKWTATFIEKKNKCYKWEVNWVIQNNCYTLIK